MAEFNFNDLGEGLRTIFLAGVGAVATGAEKGQQLVEDLVKKGEISVDQGKVLNSELSRKAQTATKDAFNTATDAAGDAAAKAKEVFSDVKDAALKARLSAMSDEERVEYVAKVQEFAAALAADTADQTDKPSVDTEVAADIEQAAEAPAADADTAAADTKDVE